MAIFDKTPFDGLDLSFGTPLHMGNQEELTSTYPLLAGEKSTIDLIRQYEHKEYPNCKHGHFVVTCGAKQALMAAVYAVHQYKDARHGLVPLNFPYWPCLKDVAELHRVPFDEEDIGFALPDDTTILVSPNNPDGTVVGELCDIWDAAYASKTYGFNQLSPVPKHLVQVRSGSKEFGIPGARVGWLATNDTEIAKYAAEYVEKATGGVSKVDQDILTRYLTSPLVDRSGYLLANAKLFNELIGPFCDTIKGTPATGLGMFAWFLPRDPLRFDGACKAAKVRIAQGKLFGGPEWTDWRRMSMGAIEEDMRLYLTALSEALS